MFYKKINNSDIKNFSTSIYIEPQKREIGERIETKVARISDLNEPITDGAPYIDTIAEDGVIPETNIRTDKFDEALDQLTETYRSMQKARAEKFAEIQKNLTDKMGNGSEEAGESSAE